MNIDAESVQEILEQAQEEYEDETVLTEDLIRSPDRRLQYNECSEDRAVHAEDARSGLHKIAVTNIVEAITGCEKNRYLNSLNSRITGTETVEDDIVGDLLKIVDGMAVPAHLYIPDKPSYKVELEQQGFSNQIGAVNKAKLHWLRPEYFDGNQALLTNNKLYVKQRLQGSTPVISDKIKSDSLPGDHSENRLQTHIRRVRGGDYEFSFQTKHAVSDRDGNGEVTEIKLPSQN